MGVDPVGAGTVDIAGAEKGSPVNPEQGTAVNSHPYDPWGRMDPSPVIGLTTSAGRYIDAGLDKAWVVDAHYEFVLFNASVEASFPESEDEWRSRFYLGWGTFQLFQVQRGWGDGGNSWRLRTDLTLPTGVYPSMTGRPVWFDTRLAPVLSLAVDYMDGYKRYGVLMGVVW